jgi:hypothetical protein
LPGAEKVIFCRAFYLLTASRLLLQFRPFKDVVHYFSQKSASPEIVISLVSSDRVALLLNAAATMSPFSTCLSKSLAGSVLFKSLGYQTVLHIGVKREGGELFEAHAWLTLNGNVLVGNRIDLAQYQELPFRFAGSSTTEKLSL